MAKDPSSNNKKSNTTETVKAYADEAKAPDKAEVKTATPEEVGTIPFPTDDVREVAPAPVKAEEPSGATGDYKYPLEVFMANAPGMVGYENYVVVGAVAGRDETEFTIGQMEQLIQQFLNRPIS